MKYARTVAIGMLLSKKTTKRNKRRWNDNIIGGKNSGCRLDKFLRRGDFK